MNRDNHAIYTPCRIGALRIPNRFVRSATADISLGKLRGFTEEDVALYKALAQGGAGLIIVNGPPILPIAACQLNSFVDRAYCYDEIRVDNTSHVLAAIRDANPECKVIAQLECNALISGSRPAGPSPVTSPFFDGVYRELEVEEIRAVIDATVHTIEHMKQEGFDGVQLHAAHGGGFWYFLSPRGNQRTDSYGGSTSNRVRIVAEIVREARKRVGDFPLLIKANCTDYLDGGIDQNSFPELARALERAGLDAIEVSGGTWDALVRSENELGFRPIPAAESHTDISSPGKQNYFLPFVEGLNLGIPIILVGGIRNVESAEAIIQSGAVQFVAMCRPLIREPNLIERWRRGDGDSEAACLACNSCIYSMYLSFDELGAKTVTCLVDHDRKLHAKAQHWLSTFIDQIRVRLDASVSERQK